MSALCSSAASSAKTSTILAKLEPMTVMGSASVRMPEIIATIVTILPTGVTG